MKQFFKFMFASMLGTFFMMIIAFFLLMGIIVSAISFSEKEVVKVNENSILHIKLEGIVNDRSFDNPLQTFDFNEMKNKYEPGLNDILLTIKKAKNDKNIKGIYLDLTDINFGISILEEIRNSLEDFKKSGKFIVSYSEMFSQKAYYLASVANKVYLNKEGSIDFHGLAAQIMFFKGLLQKLDIDVKVIRHGKYKSAVEPFILDKMSDANKEQTRLFIGSIWNHIIKNISESRKIEIAGLHNIADSLLLQTPEDALKYKFVDELVYKDQMNEILNKNLKIKAGETLSLISLNKYKDANNQNIKTKYSANKIAVIYAIGEIQKGKGDDLTIGSERISEAIQSARTDNNIKAIVLRVNSPGGDALASEIIWREVALAKLAKPVIVSMGDYAASGGYYIACAADKIIASPTTITGSIGVFGLIPNLQKFLNNKLGISFDTVMTNKNSVNLSGVQPMSNYQEKIIQNHIERIYATFINHVAEGRKMPVEKVDSIGQGRVWSGYDAKSIGLVDDFGGLEYAVAEAAKLAKITEYKVTEYPKQKGFLQQVIDEISGKESSINNILEKELGENYSVFKNVQKINNLKGCQTRLPYFIELN